MGEFKCKGNFIFLNLNRRLDKVKMLVVTNRIEHNSISTTDKNSASNLIELEKYYFFYHMYEDRGRVNFLSYNHKSKFWVLCKEIVRVFDEEKYLYLIIA